ncbi:MAG: aspartate kinase [Ginsengibacter sp.]
MKVYKFGGASVESIDRIKAVTEIIEKAKNEHLLIVISAMGKTTNALEKVAEQFYAGKKEQALDLFEQIKNHHLTILKNLISLNRKIATDHLKNFFTEIEWLLHDKPIQGYDYYYDQIVCVGELLSTSIISDYLAEQGINNQWIDVRDVIRTDDNFRDAVVDMNYASQKVEETILPLFKKTNIVITQGFIGSTDENESTTLGREGSDYSAALFSNLLNAESLTIWKDVKGIMNGDPKEFPESTFIQDLGFNEVIEMAYYGAQVIHPKTIKPLQNKNIPLHVRSFLDTTLHGTLISNTTVHHLPPIQIVKKNQVILKLTTKDFSFIGELPISRLYQIFSELKIHSNLTQNGAIHLLMCLDDHPEKIEKLALAASEEFDVHLERGLKLWTVRHYTDGVIEPILKNNNIVVEQRTPKTVQFVIRD